MRFRTIQLRSRVIPREMANETQNETAVILESLDIQSI